MEYYDEDISSKSPMITLFLLLIFGTLGAHRFYVKKYITGLLYLAVGISTVVIDFIEFKYSFIAQAVAFFLIAIDLLALYTESFTDGDGKLLSTEKALLYDTDEEREEKLFVAKLNKIILVLLALAFHIIYFVINYVL